METFKTLGINEKTIEKLKNLGIEEPTAVQRETIPLIFKGENLLFQSETGTGKTLAFLLPLLERIEKENNDEKNETNSKGVKIIIVSPTYELSSQIKQQLSCVSDEKAILLIGSAPLKRQIEMLKEKPSVAIGSASRIVELFRLKKLKIDENCVLVLDEVDRLLSKEMIRETAEIISILKKDSQIVGCSATVGNKVVSELEKIAGRKFEEKFLPFEDILRKRITHIAIFAESRDKIDTLRKLIASEKFGKMLVFTKETRQVEIIAEKLRYKKIDCVTLASKTDKQKRKAAIDGFKSGKAKIMVTSDLASRGLDIQNITHVVQMDLPASDDFFIHRAGRTARAGLTGLNIVIGDEYEMQKFSRLEKKLKIVVYPKILYKGKMVAPDFEENFRERK